MRWFLVFLCLMIASPAISSGPMNGRIQKKIESTSKFQQEQAKKFEELLRELRRQFQKRREIPNNVRIPKRQYRYRK